MGAFDELNTTRKTFGSEAAEGQSPLQPSASTAAAPEPLSVTSPHTEGNAFTEERAFTSPTGGQPSGPKFMCIDVDDTAMHGFSREYNPAMDMEICIADKTMLLEYMVATERRYNITMSFPAYGVDPIVFDEVLKEMRSKREPDVGIEDDQSATEMPPVVAINIKGRNGENGQEPGEMYEKIDVDNVLYLSCISECLDKEYLHKVIAEATEAVYMHGSYIYTLVGPRPLTIDGEAQGEFIETLKLNSYELSVLLSYMQKIDGVKVYHGVFDGRSAIKFTR